MVEPHYQHLKTSSEQGILILTVLPHLLLDEEVVDALQHDLLVAMDYHKPQKLVLDFHQVKALGSVAFRPVIALQRRVQEAGGRLLLCGLASMVAEVFHLTGLVRAEPSKAGVLAATPTLADAVAQLSGPSV